MDESLIAILSRTHIRHLCNSFEIILSPAMKTGLLLQVYLDLLTEQNIIWLSGASESLIWGLCCEIKMSSDNHVRRHLKINAVCMLKIN